jgi:hypothetical protein
MVHLLKETQPVATDRSIFIGTIILLYMILFGRSIPPSKINPNII